MLLQMSLATNTTLNFGMMGIGYDNNVDFANSSLRYKNLGDEMVNNNLTNTKLYSLWLNDLNSSTGNILFGGIDTDKYHGTLLSMPIYPYDTGDYIDFTVLLTSISLTPQVSVAIPVTNSNFVDEVILEPSVPFIWLPDDYCYHYL